MTTLAEAITRSEDCLSSLEKDFQKRARGWLQEMVQSGIRPLIYCGYRSNEEQAALYAQGRTRSGKIVTKAAPGQSYHNYRLAFDWVPLKKTAKDPDLFYADWDNETAYTMGEQAGLTFQLASISWEQGHLQDARYKSWRDIASGIIVAPKVRKATSLVSNRPWSSR